MENMEIRRPSVYNSYITILFSQEEHGKFQDKVVEFAKGY